jgi:hypothetical protein
MVRAAIMGPQTRSAQDDNSSFLGVAEAAPLLQSLFILEAPKKARA